MAGLGKDIKVDGQNYADDVAVPKDTTANTDSLLLGEGAQNASVNIKGVVTESVKLADTKKLTVKLQDSADDSSFADKAVLAEYTADGETYSIPLNTVIFNHVLAPDTRKFTRISLITDDATADGKLDLYPQIVPR